MKFAFSSKGWHDASFDEMCKIAKELKYDGIELHNTHGSLFTAKGGAFYDYKSAATTRKLFELKLKIPCVDSICSFNKMEDFEDSVKEIEHCISVAAALRIPYLRVKTDDSGDIEVIKSVIDKVLPSAKANGVILLVETCGIFSDTTKLCDFLNYFATDSVAALWNISASYFFGKEEPETTITNLGVYIKHVHICDGVLLDGELKHSLIGEGDLPISDVIASLRSINFDGFISLEWDPQWFIELNDMEIIFAHFIKFIRQFGDTAKGKENLYFNNAHTGNFVWKKELLIDETFPAVLDRMVREFPDQYAFKYTTLDYTRTYSEFRDDVDTFARTLIALGVKKGTHVAVWATNIPQWYIAFWAATKIGAVLVTVNTAYKIHEAEYLFKQSDTHTIVMIEGFRDSNYSEIMAELCPELATKKRGEPLFSRRLPQLRNIITVGFEQKGCIKWEDAINLADSVPLDTVYKMASEVGKNDVCNMQYTSGTTGFPKGVMLTHYNVVNNGKCIGDRMDLSTADRMMIQVPMFHCFGMVLAMTASMTHGTTLCPLPYFSPKPALACINNEHITAFHGVPTMFIALLEHPDFKKTDFSYMRTGIMAGSPCPISVMRDVVDKMNMREIVIVYGQTEASPGCTMSSTDDPLEVRVGTVGGPMPEIECKIVNPETGEDCPDEVTGEFVARGYNIMKGYYKMPKATAAAIDKDGWLHTGDLACRTKEGNYRITGRLKDMIIRGGENIYPKEIEEFIYTHEKVKDVQVIGVPDEQYGEEILAAVILKDGESMTEQELKDYVMAHMAKHKVPRYVDFVKEFPMNVAGKI
ncbi:MAG: AMP-binding protein, partial [Clostridia bacterium]|nr:AMP-binding protein [Clostridia bacterium]